MGYIITDGRYYVMDDPTRRNQGKWIKTTYSVQATVFNYKQAKNLMNSKKGRLAWIKELQIVDVETGQPVDPQKVQSPGNGGVFTGDDKFTFDEAIVDEINKERDKIIDLKAWTEDELDEQENILNQAMQYYDSALSDIYHARMEQDPSPKAVKKIDQMNNDLHKKRRDVKQAIVFIKAMKRMITEKTGLDQLKADLVKEEFTDYKGRTEYYEEVQKIMIEEEADDEDADQTQGFSQEPAMDAVVETSSKTILMDHETKAASA